MADSAGGGARGAAVLVGKLGSGMTSSTATERGDLCAAYVARTGRLSSGSAWVESVVRRHADALTGMPTRRPAAWPYARRRLRPDRSVIDEASGPPAGAVRRSASVAGTCQWQAHLSGLPMRCTSLGRYRLGPHH